MKTTGTRRRKCSSKFDTISMNRPNVEVANCDIVIDTVTININKTSRIHSINDANGYSITGGNINGILGSLKIPQWSTNVICSDAD